MVGSRLPKAKDFRHWVTNTVLPSIRKNGGYIQNQEEMTPEQIVANALIVANKIIAEKEATIVEMKPKADYFDNLVDSRLLTTFRDTAKELHMPPKQFTGWLTEKNGIGKILPSDLVPAFANGGFPEDGLFMANHSELVGQFSNGKTAVANNDQIVTGIENGVYRGMMRAQSEDTEVTSLLGEILTAIKDGKKIVVDGRELVSIYDNRKSRNGFSFT